MDIFTDVDTYDNEVHYNKFNCVNMIEMKKNNNANPFNSKLTTEQVLNFMNNITPIESVNGLVWDDLEFGYGDNFENYFVKQLKEEAIKLANNGYKIVQYSNDGIGATYPPCYFYKLVVINPITNSIEYKRFTFHNKEKKTSWV
jgi:hypothetical protein